MNIMDIVNMDEFAFLHQLVSKDDGMNPYQYLSLPIKNAITETLLINYLFKDNKKELFSLNTKISSQKPSLCLKPLFNELLEITSSSPLFFFEELTKEINRIIDHNPSDITLDKYINLEVILAWHFLNNFNVIPQETALPDIRFDYSFAALRTIFDFAKVFEYHSLCTKIKDKYLDIKDYFSIGKVFYFYHDKMRKQEKTFPCGNLIQFFLSQLDKKIQANKRNVVLSSPEGKTLNYNLENYIVMNLFMIRQLIIKYSFYFSKKAELLPIFNQLHDFIQFPLPTGILTEELLDITYNEMVFQGINILNQLRKDFFIDLMSNDTTEIDVKKFKGVLILSSNSKGTFLDSFVTQLIANDQKKGDCKLQLKDFYIKILLTFVYNSHLKISDETIRTIASSDFTQSSTVSIKETLVALFGFIDQGLENEEGFNEKINHLLNKLLQTTSSTTIHKELGLDEMLPITAFRKYLKPRYIKHATLSVELPFMKQSSTLKRTAFDLFSIYKKEFESLVKTYYPFLLEDEYDKNKERTLQELRQNVINHFRLNILLFEEKGSISQFIEDLRNTFYSFSVVKFTTHEQESFWQYFIQDILAFQPNFLLHIIPNYSRNQENPLRIIGDIKKTECSIAYLSEFLAYNDVLYKNIIYIPFASIDETTSTSADSYLRKSTLSAMKNGIQKSQTAINNTFKKPLEYYFSDSNGIFNLEIYKLQLEGSAYLKLFWNSCTIKLNQSSNTKLTICCVDYLGLEQKEENIDVIITEPFVIKMFNLLNKKDVPFNYNMTSNNGWLEIFICDDKIMNDKIDNYIKKCKSNKYYEEGNQPQIDLDTPFRNYKVKRMKLTTSTSKLIVNYDHNEVFDFALNAKKMKKQFNKSQNNTQKEYTIKVGHFKTESGNITLPIATFGTI